MNLFYAIATAYVLTFLIASSNVLYPARAWIKKHTPFLKINRKHFIDCRMCIGFWISIVATYEYALTPEAFFAVYGVSYFIATQERK